jgi:hypothetical protein
MAVLRVALLKLIDFRIWVSKVIKKFKQLKPLFPTHHRNL